MKKLEPKDDELHSTCDSKLETAKTELRRTYGGELERLKAELRVKYKEATNAVKDSLPKDYERELEVAKGALQSHQDAVNQAEKRLEEERAREKGLLTELPNPSKFQAPPARE